MKQHLRKMPSIALVTYSTKPRGGVVHTLELAEELYARGTDVTVIGMGDPSVGFFRSVTAPTQIVTAPAWSKSLTERVFSWIDALTDSLQQSVGSAGDRFGIIHTQDCISARAACRVRDRGAPFQVWRTVHHTDDFTTQALIDCQSAAITEPDRLLVVSQAWQHRLKVDYGVKADVVSNGVRVERYASSNSANTNRQRHKLRASINATGRHLFLTVGGIEPRKGSEYLMKALSLLQTELHQRPTPQTEPHQRPTPQNTEPHQPPTPQTEPHQRPTPQNTEPHQPPTPQNTEPHQPPTPQNEPHQRPAMLAVVGGHSFQDYRDYRQRVLGSLASMGLTLGDNIVLLGTVADEDMPGWFAAADSFVFPSVEEGWGLVVLEALAAGLPVITSDIDVFGEFLRHEHDALFSKAGNADSLAAQMARLRRDTKLADRLRSAGFDTARRYSWATTARQHENLYRST